MRIEDLDRMRDSLIGRKLSPNLARMIRKLRDEGHGRQRAHFAGTINGLVRMNEGRPSATTNIRGAERKKGRRRRTKGSTNIPRANGPRKERR